jgi:hypothetical protein
LALQKQTSRKQQGGAEAMDGTGPVLAGVLTALLIAGGAKGAYDVLKSYTN